MTPPPRHTAIRTPPGSVAASAPSTPSMEMIQAMLQAVAGIYKISCVRNCDGKETIQPYKA